MTEKVKKVYSRLSIKWKISIGLSIVVMFLTSFIFVALASGISFTGQTPAAGTTTGNAAPAISVEAPAEEGTVSAEDVKMLLNGGEVTPNLSFSSGSYTISYVPTEKLKNGAQSVTVNVYDSTSEWSFNVDAAPNASNWYPAKSSTVMVSNPRVSVYVKDTFDNLNAGSLAVKVNGQPVEARMDYKGYFETCSGIWVIESYKEGTISFDTWGLPEGNNSIEISIADIKGNVLTESWTFNVDALPVPSQYTPAKGSTVSIANPAISLYVAAKDANLNSQSLSTKLNGQPVAAQLQYKGYFDTCSGVWVIRSYKEGTVKFNSSGLQDGINTVEISIADNAGNKLKETWSFTVAEKPEITNLLPVNGSENLNLTRVSAVINDNSSVDWDNVKLYVNNNEVSSYAYNEETGQLTYNYNFPTGNHQVLLKAVDMNGNQSTASWSFISSSKGPELTQLQYFSGGMTIKNGVLKFFAQLNHIVDMKDTATLKLNGIPLDIDFRFKGYTDTCSGDLNYIILSRKEAYVSYEKKVIDGENLTLELFAEDKYGYGRIWTWTFNVVTPPAITDVTPMKYGVTQLQPTISATVKDNDEIPSLVMKLNGVDVNYQYDAGTGKLTYIPSEPLSNETDYTVSVTAADGIGLTASSTWKFTVNTYPDMYDGNVTSCQSCHENQSSRAPYEAIHPEGLFQGHENSCDNCHIYVTIPDVCSGCHYPGQVLPEPFPPHNESPGTKYSPQRHSTTEALRVTTNREVWDCIICHQPGAGTKTGPTWGNNRLLNNHDIPQLHLAPQTQDSESCTGCHARSLTREHARDGRVDAAGNAINCNTCHMSTNSAVKAAITEKDKSCSACHGFADHESVHMSNLDSNCQTCHAGALTQEHMDNPKTNPNKNYSCETCHSSAANISVKRTIAANNLKCAGCHTEGHNILFVDMVPADIALYSGFAWTSPIEASIFSGEAASPAGYEAGQVVLSDRRNDVTVDELWAYYNEQLTADGWKLKSGAPPPGAALIAAEFEKQARYVTVKLYNTAKGDGTGLNTYGYRIEIWYK